MALTLVTSGTTTPTVGQNSSLTTQTPSTNPLLYVHEVDTSAMQPGDGAILAIRKQGAAKPSAASVMPNAVSASGNAASVTGTCPAGILLALSGEQANAAVSAPSDSLGSTWTQLAGQLYAAYPLGSSEWGSAPAVGPFSVTNTAIASVSVVLGFASVTGVALDAIHGAYGSATGTTTVTTSASVTSGDLVIAWTMGNHAAEIAAFVATSTGTVTYTPTVGGTTITQPTGWAGLGYIWQSGSGGASVSAVGIVALPAATAKTVYMCQVAGSGAQIKQSPPVPTRTTETVEWDLLQFQGTARAFPWAAWNL